MTSAIEILTLFLGLVFGPQIAELAVHSTTRAVELRVDGEVVAERALSADEAAAGDPLHLTFDLGPGLAPHELLATAFDSHGEVLGRSRQWLNLPQERAQARLFLDVSGDRPQATLSWRAVDFPTPRAVLITLDGEPVPRSLGADGQSATLALPAVDLGSLHILSAEVVFTDDVRARADRVFGGPYAEETATQLTAMVVNSRRRRPERMAGWFQVDGVPVRAVAMEAGPAEVIVVRERSAALDASLRRLMGEYSILATRSNRTRGASVLDRGDRIRFVMPGWQAQADGVAGERDPSEILPVTRGEIAVRSVVEAVFAQRLPNETPLTRQPLAEAVAVAGIWAAGGHRRSLVLLVRSGDADDESRVSPDQVRAFLATLGVPLRVWNVGASKDQRNTWGAHRDLGSAPEIASALGGLRGVLAAQQVIWIAGQVPAHQIEITDRARGMERPH